MTRALTVAVMLSVLAAGAAGAAEFKSKKRMWFGLQRLGAEIGQVKACMQAYATNGTDYEQYWPVLNGLSRRAARDVETYVTFGADGHPDPADWHHAWEAVIRAQLETEAATNLAACAGLLEAAARKSTDQ